MPGATTFPFGPPPKKFHFQAMGHFSGLTLVFGHFGLLSVHKNKYLIFGTVFIKKMTQNDNGLGPSQNYGETAVFTFFLAKNEF